MTQRHRVRLGTGLTLLVLAIVLLMACRHQDIGVTYENRTTVDLFGDINGGGFEKIEAGEARTIGHRLSDDAGHEVEVTVKTEAGDVVYHRVFSDREDLENATRNKIVLEALPAVEP